MFMRGGPNFICIHLQRVTQVIPRCRYVSIKIVKSTKEDRLVIKDLDFHNISKTWNHF